MKLIKYSVLASVLALSALFSQPANAFSLGGLSRDAGVALKPISRPSKAPLAYMMLCLTAPRHCQAGNETMINYGYDMAGMIEKVNRRVNKAIKPRLEKRDIWTVGTASGDCEEFALTKRRDLIESGIPAGALRMAVVLTEKGEGHAVLVVRTDVGDLVLDNRRANIVISQKTGYEFLKMATANPLSWVELDHSQYSRNYHVSYDT